ncbi:hypothetical protein [Paraburkholderia phosphatilytica]|uniref:hypothetical protein n=1 Tax=Paraburkholderia phosphatilytica TaxID=2282883 RepID=UPI000E4DFA51|nr:hypothetical protein [Paraburkholderia phosphatilytica]
MNIFSKRDKKVEQAPKDTGATFFAAADVKPEAQPEETAQPTAQPAPSKPTATFLSVSAGQGARSDDPLARHGAMAELSTHRRQSMTTDYGGHNDRIAQLHEEQERRALAGMMWMQGLPQK